MNLKRSLGFGCATLLGLMTFLPVGCATRSGAKGCAPATAASVEALAGADLKLARLFVDGRDVKLPADNAMSLRFGEAGQLAGRSAVNRFSGGYELVEQGRINWPGAGFMTTRMAGPPEAMSLERYFLTALASTCRLQTCERGAVFLNADGSTRLEFLKPEPGAAGAK